MSQQLYNQKSLFLKSEGDNYYKRSKGRDSGIESFIQILDSYSIKPNTILDVGCSGGSKLAFLTKYFSATGSGVEPSLSAVVDARKQHTGLRFEQGDASDLHFFEDASFDFIVINFVLHWVDRALLLRAYSELDRVLVDGGHILIGDFYPPTPCCVLYHHVVEQKVYTFKQDYSEPLLTSNLYSLVHKTTIMTEPLDTPGEMHRKIGCLTLLRKDLMGRYVNK